MLPNDNIILIIFTGIHTTLPVPRDVFKVKTHTYKYIYTTNTIYKFIFMYKKHEKQIC